MLTTSMLFEEEQKDQKDKYLSWKYALPLFTAAGVAGLGVNSYLRSHSPERAEMERQNMEHQRQMQDRMREMEDRGVPDPWV